MSIVNVEALKGLGAQLWWPGAVASANSPKAITSYGNVKQLLPFSGAGIGMFDGTGDYLQVNDSDEFYFGSGNFTVETLIYLTATSGIVCNVYDQRLDTNTRITCNLSSNGYIYFVILVGGTTTVNSSGIYTSYTKIGWNHIAYVKSGTTYATYVNGYQVSAITDSDEMPNIAAPITLFGVPTASLYHTGNVSEVRVSNVARYTAAFTPPKRQLESDSNTKLLLHFNRNDSTFIDSSPSAHTITSYGDAKQLCSPCGSGVAYFDGSGDYLTVGSASDYNFLHNLGTSQKWSIAFYYDISSLPTHRCILSNCGHSSNVGIELLIATGGQIYIRILRGVSGTNYIDAVTPIETPIPFGDGMHYCVCTYDQALASGNFKVYVDGVFYGSINKGTLSTSTRNATNTMKCGYSHQTDTPYYMNGYLSELIIIKDVCIDPIPLTLPFQPNPYTKLLLHMDGQGNAFYDSSDPPGDNGFPILPDGVTVTPSGTFTSVKGKDGRNYWKFDGSTNCITISDHASWSMFLNDFTIAVWIKFDSVAANRAIIGQYTDANNQWYLQWTTSNVIQLYGITSSTARFDFTCPLTPVAGTWYHVVVQRSGSSCIMYINGVAQTVTQTTAFSATATDIAAVLSIGKINTEYQAGNTKDLMIFHKALTLDQVSALMSETYIY